MIAIGYIRVSTEEQVQNGVSLDMQETKIRQYCMLHDLELAGIYGDRGISAKNTEARPGVMAVLHMVDKQRIDAVVVYKLDRLVRSTVDALNIAQQLDRKGVGLHSITEKFDTRSAVGELIFTLMAALAQMERKLIGERTCAALRSKQEKGQRISRFAPYGYEFDGKGNLLKSSTEQEAIQRIKELAHTGKSLGRISNALADKGFLARSGKPLSKSTINKILNR